LTPRYVSINIPSSPLCHLDKSTFEDKYARTVVSILSDYFIDQTNVVVQANSINDIFIVRRIIRKFHFPIIFVLNRSIKIKTTENENEKLEKNGSFNFLKFEIPDESSYTEMFQIADLIVSFTSIKKKFLISSFHLDQDKIRIISNGIRLDKFQILSKSEKNLLKTRLGFNCKEKIVLFYGEIDPLDEVSLLIDAFLAVSENIDDVRFVLIGDGQIIKCIQKYLQYYGKIMITGQLPLKIVREFYQIADVTIVHSSYADCLYTILEMILFKIPVILCGNRNFEIFDETEYKLVTSIINDKSDLIYIDKLKNAIQEILMNNKLASKLASESIKGLNENYSAKHMAIGMNKVYQSLLTSSK
jgi:glycosyltransferase involved in cell wall biosynthesis